MPRVPLLVLLICVALPLSLASVSQLLLLRASPSGLALSWLSQPPQDGAAFLVLYGSASAPLSQTARVNQSVASAQWNGSIHSALLGDLEPDQMYSYAVADATGTRLLSTVRTARSPPDAGDDVRFVAMANAGASVDALSVLAAVERRVLQRPDPPLAGVLLPGDLGFGSPNDADALTAWASLLSSTSLGSGVPVLTSLGHAELDRDPTALTYLARLGHLMPSASALCWSTDVGGVHVVSFSTEAVPPDVLLPWLRADLSAAAAARESKDTHFVVTMAHTPPFSTNAAVNATATAQAQALLIPLLSEWGVDLALWGHVPAYERSHPLGGPDGVTIVSPGNGTVHLSLGSAGQPPSDQWLDPQPWSAYREAALGFVLLTVDHQNGSLNVQFVRVNGSVGDDLWIQRESDGTEAGPVLLIATISSLLIIGGAVAVVFFLMRRLGHVPAQTYDQLGQEIEQQGDNKNNSSL